MAKKVNIVGTQPKRVRVLDKPRRRIEPAELAAALGAEPSGEHVGANLDAISLAELGTELLRRLRSSGGRPALSDATELCRVPLSAEDVKALERITEQIEQNTGTKPSPGQVASVIVRDYLNAASAASQEARLSATPINEVNVTDEAQQALSLSLVKALINDGLEPLRAELHRLATKLGDTE